MTEQDLEIQELRRELQAYKMTGSEDAILRLAAQVLDTTPRHLRELVHAEKDGRLVVLPCKDVTVYTIQEDYFNCDACENNCKAHYNPNIQRRCCDMETHCPLRIEEHTVEGFEVAIKDGNVALSSPGKWGYEGLEHFIGIDNKWYLTRAEAEAALEGGAE